MPNDILTKYSAQQTITAAIGSLASDTNLLAGLETSIIDNTTDGYEDIILSGFITTGTSPTASRIIEVWAIAWNGSGWPDVFDGTESAETITSADIKASICRLVAAMATANTSDRVYHFGPVSIAAAFGGVVPPKIVLFVTHSTGVALNSTAGNHQIRLQPVYETVT